MSTPDATPSRDDDVVAVPDHVYRTLREAAERKLRDACDLAFSPDARDAAIEAVNCIDAFTDRPAAPFISPRLSLTVALALIPTAIAWKESEARPSQTIQDVAHNGRLQLDIQELVELRDRLIGAASQDDEQVDVEEGSR